MEESGRPAATYPFPHPPSSPASRPASPPSQQTTTKDYQRLWKDVTSKNDEGEAVRILTNILQDAEGTTFISDLALDDAELCIEMLDHVSRDLHLLPAFTVTNGLFRASQGTISIAQRNRLSSSR